MSETTILQPSQSALSTNRLIRNTYTMLSMTLMFSAVMAGISTAMNMPPITYLVSIGIAFLLIWFALPRTVNSTSGLGVVFAITGLMGFALGPLLNVYLSLPSGGEIVMTAMGGTGAIFLGLSAYALTSRKDFSFLGGALFGGMLVVLLAAIANIFFSIPALSLAISSIVVILMSGFILFDTSRMVNGGETNYLHMTVSLYLNIFNLFVSLLHLLGALSNND
jgi:modulator of FtsH protease